MDSKGFDAKGFDFVGQPTLGTIGNLVFRYDYRFGLTTQLISGQNRILTLADLGPNGLDLQALSARQPRLFSDGIGTIGSSCELRYLGDRLDLLTPLHNGTPHFFYTVLQCDNPTNAAQQSQVLVTSNTGKPGTQFLVDTSGSNNRFGQGYQNNAGAGAGQQLTAIGTLPEDSTFRLITFTWYGNGGSNNSRITIGNQSYSASRNLTLGTDNPNRFLVFNMTNATQDIVRFKTCGAYILAGKSIAQIDAFVTTFHQTLKRDSEYANLLTI
jgi:hypothetical protein